MSVFISHHTNTTFRLAQELSRILEKYGIEHWYAERDIKPLENYTEVIPRVIKKSKFLVLLLNKESNVSKQVLREVQYAENIPIPVMVARLDDCELSPSIAYLASTDQQLDLRGLNRVMAAQKLAQAISEWISGESVVSSSGDLFKYERAENSLEFYGDEGERKRLESQHNFIYEFAHEYYDEFISNYENATFLDVGCNTGKQAMMFVDGRKEIDKYIGIDREIAAIERGKELFPNAYFYVGNCVSDEFDDLLYRIEEELDIDGFDIINLSMVLLHIKEPHILLDTLRSHLNEGGRIIILDIDDGLSIAYPDPDEMFKKAVDICAQTGYSGFRQSGRQIAELLYDVEMEHIELHKQGMSTIGMSREKRAAFFDLFFWFILDDLRKMHALAPDDKLIEADWQWMEKNYKEMRNLFKKKSFYFNIGFMLFSAM